MCTSLGEGEEKKKKKKKRTFEKIKERADMTIASFWVSSDMRLFLSEEDFFQ